MGCGVDRYVNMTVFKSACMLGRWVVVNSCECVDVQIALTGRLIM